MDPIITILGLIVAGLALYRNIVLTKEQVNAKDAQIDTLNSQIELLKQLTPAGILDQYVGVKTLLEDQIKDSQAQISSQHERIGDLVKEREEYDSQHQLQTEKKVVSVKKVMAMYATIFQIERTIVLLMASLTIYSGLGIERKRNDAPSSASLRDRLGHLAEVLNSYTVESLDSLWREFPDEEFYTRLDSTELPEDYDSLKSELFEIQGLIWSQLDRERDAKGSG